MNRQALLLEQWKAASELHRQENELIWHRFNYFIAINVALTTSLAIVWFTAPTSQPNPNAHIGEAALSILGAVTSAIWAITQRRGQLYNRYRVAQARAAEEQLTIDNERVLTLYEKDIVQQGAVPVPWLAKWSTQTVVFWLAVVLALSWLTSFACFLIA